MEILWWNRKIGTGYNDLNIRSVTGTQLYLKTDGNVGIGTDSPSSRLEVRAETATHKLVSLNREASDTAAMYLGNDSSNNAIISSNYENNSLMWVLNNKKSKPEASNVI